MPRWKDNTDTDLKYGFEVVDWIDVPLNSVQ